MASMTTTKSGGKIIQFIDARGKRRTIRLGKMSGKQAGMVQAHVEELVAASKTHATPKPATLAYISGLDQVMRDKLADVGLVVRRDVQTLGEFLDAYIDGRTDVKDSTRLIYDIVRSNLTDYFGRGKALRDITVGDAERWERHLKNMKPRVRRQTKAPVVPIPKLAELGDADADADHDDTPKMARNTVRRRVSIAKQFFIAAVKDGALQVNPFAGMGGPVKGNREREFFVTREIAERVIDKAPDAEWRLIIALSRYGGLRCPSEHLALTWQNVNFNEGTMLVESPKTAHEEGHEARLVPIFPELRPYLEDAASVAQRGQKYVISRYRDTRSNLRTQFMRIIKKAGVEPWPKLFQNLRSTRETELAEIWPGHVVCAWIGNSPKVAQEHYLQVTSEHFRPAGRAARCKKRCSILL